MSGGKLREEIIAAGFGGQGIMLLGKLIAMAGMLEGRQVTYIPSYGAEVRGGTANCSVILSDDEIASPLVSAPHTALVMNHPSLTKFGPLVKAGGLLVVNTTLALEPPSRSDIEVALVPATESADQLGAIQVANMVMLGAYLARKPIVQIETILDVLRQVLPKRRHHLIGLNEQAIRRGQELAQDAAPGKRAAAKRAPARATGKP